MITLSPNHAACLTCTFSPFCKADHDIAAVKRHRILQRHEMLCLPSLKFQSLYAVQHGALKTYQVDAEGNEVVRGFYFAGEVLGYEAIYTNQYPFSAVALTETLICEIAYDQFLELMRTRQPLQKHALYLMSKQLNSGIYRAACTAEQRLAAFIIDLSSRLNPTENNTHLQLLMSRQEIGNYLRLTAETVSRVLSRLKKNKIIGIDYKNLHIKQPETLQKIASGLTF